MVRIPCIACDSPDDCLRRSRMPILQFKELLPDSIRWEAWKYWIRTEVNPSMKKSGKKKGKKGCSCK